MKRGFSLLETIIYIGITALMLSALIVVSFQLISTSVDINESIFALEEGDYLKHKIEWILNSSSSIEIISLVNNAVTLSDISIISSSTYTKVNFKINNYPFEATNFFP